jgi:hypothetical protein
VSRWAPAIATLGGLAASALALELFGWTVAGVVLLATACAAFRSPVIGDTPVLDPATSIDPAAVRRYREDHPGATISDAVAAVSRR